MWYCSTPFFIRFSQERFLLKWITAITCLKENNVCHHLMVISAVVVQVRFMFSLLHIYTVAYETESEHMVYIILCTVPAKHSFVTITNHLGGELV